ncbi:hypothetical protein KC340_g349 [Hortaea werneckii]|nr:hypothetical protein KC339_g1005 [Hortaea werneckii]KAI7245583.1 hypothetical protein KC365_g333 [Hortaea werneckii]KAI7340285.1 hypothetical protein KC340_g349 [Hortaea werneckii]KAI7391369.1 hypothetical protein KC328_g7526 [Hortaea werneckii]
MPWNAVNYAPGYKTLDPIPPVVPKKRGKKHIPRENTKEETKPLPNVSQRDGLDDDPIQGHYDPSGDDETDASSTLQTVAKGIEKHTLLTDTYQSHMRRFMPSQDETDALGLDLELAQEIFNQLHGLCMVDGIPDEDAAKNVGQGITYVTNGWKDLDSKHNNSSKDYYLVANPFETGKAATTGVSEKFIAVGREAAQALSNALIRSKASAVNDSGWTEAKVLKKFSGSLRLGLEKYHLALNQSSKLKKSGNILPSDRVPQDKKDLRDTKSGSTAKAGKKKTVVPLKLRAIKLKAPTATEMANCGADGRATLLMFEKLEAIFLNDGDGSHEAATAICMAINTVFVPWDELKEEDINAHIDALPQAWTKVNRKIEGDGDSDTSRMMNSVLEAVERMRLSDGQDMKPEVYTRELLGVKLSMEKVYAQLRDWLEPPAQAEALTQVETASKASKAPGNRGKRPLEEAAIPLNTPDQPTKRAKIDKKEAMVGTGFKIRVKRGKTAPQWTQEECHALLQLWDHPDFPFWSPDDRTKTFNLWREIKELGDARTRDAMEQRIKALIMSDENNAEGLVEATRAEKAKSAINWPHYANQAGATRKARPSQGGLSQATKSMKKKHVKTAEKSGKE